jgi:HSP20 family protein
MVDIVRRQSEKSLPALSGDWDPFSSIRQLMRWTPLGFDPFREMLPTFETRQLGSYVPAFEVKENKEGYLFHADLPGVKEDDLKVTVNSDHLTVSGKREEEKKSEDDTYYCYERSYGSFSRTFTLPNDADLEHVKADMKNGQLSLQVPKKPGHQTKEINVKVNK